jgi:hypothetical protein
VFNIDIIIIVTYKRNRLEKLLSANFHASTLVNILYHYYYYYYYYYYNYYYVSFYINFTKLLIISYKIIIIGEE